MPKQRPLFGRWRYYLRKVDGRYGKLTDLTRQQAWDERSEILVTETGPDNASTPVLQICITRARMYYYYYDYYSYALAGRGAYWELLSLFLRETCQTRLRMKCTVTLKNVY